MSVSSRITPPAVQTEIPWVQGSPEGVVAAPRGHLAVDFTVGNLYIKQTPLPLKTGWLLLSGGPTTITTGDAGLAILGNGSPEGIVAANPGRFYINTLTNAIWVKLSGAGTTGWLQETGPF